MNSVPHQFVTVDMRDLKTALVERARERRVSVSLLVREAVAYQLNLDSNVGSHDVASRIARRADSSVLTKVSFRLAIRELARLESRAVAAGLSRSAFLAGLIEGVPVLSSNDRNDCVSALIASNAELSTLSRNVRHLAVLLARSRARAAQPYRSMLDTLARDVDRHLERSGEVLSRMGSLRRPSLTSTRRSHIRKEKSDAQP